MTRKAPLVVLLVFFIAGGVIAQEKHQPFDMLLGFSAGAAMSPNIMGVFTYLSSDELSKGNYAITANIGFTYDFYLFYWLSLSTGLLFHEDLYLLLGRDYKNIDSITDIASSPVCLTIPVAAHVNIPRAEWLYAGLGLHLNIPVFGLFDGITGIDTKGDFFVGIPADIGFDFTKPEGGGGRFFFRITPEIHKGGTAFPIGFVAQINTWKLFSKNKVRQTENAALKQTAVNRQSPANYGCDTSGGVAGVPPVEGGGTQRSAAQGENFPLP
jgi:hypothetical protein